MAYFLDKASVAGYTDNMKSRQNTISNHQGRVVVERKDALISVYTDKQLALQTVIPAGTPEDRVVAVMEKLADGPVSRYMR